MGIIFDIGAKKEKLRECEKLLSDPEYYSVPEKSKPLLRSKKYLEMDIQDYESLLGMAGDAEAIFDLMEEDEDPSMKEELDQILPELEKQAEAQELKLMLSGENDVNNAIVSVNSGAGGTESQDWAEMLLRMLLRYSEREGYQAQIVDILAGEEAGVKSVTFTVTGQHAFGYLKAEAGVHRLVRISPFDSNKRRHTSFASVFVTPEVDDSIDIEIDEKDLRVDTYRSSGAGGQHVNTTDSAVRLTHLPTGAVVACQNERSQHKNKSTAMKLLKSKLYELELQKRKDDAKEVSSSKKDISFGSQIRSYVLAPYRMVKDHRTSMETSNVDAVLDGDITKFIREYLISTAGE